MDIKHIFQEIEPELKKVDTYIADLLHRKQADITNCSLSLLTAGGKRIRPALIILSSQFGKGNHQNIIPLAAAFELIHMASLVHDDVIDHAYLRRGKPTVNALYGGSFALHLGDYLFAKALNIIASYQNRVINQLVTRVGIEMCRGEMAQIKSAFNSKQVLRDYFYRISRKTTMLMSLSCQVGAIVTEAEPEEIRILKRYGHYIGMAYQIMDDVLDFSCEKKLGKPIGRDLKQGIFTLPVIYTLYSSQNIYALKLMDVLNKKNLYNDDIVEAIKIIKRAKGLDYSVCLANRYIEKGLAQLASLPDNNAKETFTNLARFVSRRSL